MHCQKPCRMDTKLGGINKLALADYVSQWPWPVHLWEQIPLLYFYLAGYLFNLNSGRCLISTQNHCHMDLWSAWLALTHHHPSSTSTPPSQESYERESKLTLFLRLPLACCLDLLSCLGLFSNSHLSIRRKWGTWVTSVHRDQPPTWLSWEPSDLSGLEPARLF